MPTKKPDGAQSHSEDLFEKILERHGFIGFWKDTQMHGELDAQPMMLKL